MTHGSEAPRSRSGRSTLLTNHLTKVSFIYLKFDNGCLLTHDFVNNNLFRHINKGLTYIFNQFTQLTHCETTLCQKVYNTYS